MTSTSPAAAVAGNHGVDDPLLRVDRLSTIFAAPDGTVHAVTDVSLEVFRGQVLGIVGESGSGKSVTARSIMRMVRRPGRIIAGRVLFEDRDLLNLPDEQMREIRGQRVSMVFQDPQATLNPVMKVGEQIAEALTVHGMNKSDARERARELLEHVGIPDAARRFGDYPHHFSGGMRQRVVIAIALANNPALLIADEPTTALDVTIQAQILRLLVGLKDDFGLAMVMITHDMGVIAELCSDVIVMYGGRVVERGTTKDVFAHPRHPYTAALLSATPRLDQDTITRPLAAISGQPPDPADLPPGCAFHPRCSVAEPTCAAERPVLEPVASRDHRAACWVAQRELPTVRNRDGEISAESLPAEETITDDADRGTPVLEVVNLRTDVGSRPRGMFGREPPTYAVDGVSVAVHAGETVGLVGESGCGKSTLSRTIVGLHKPAAGTILVDGDDVTDMRRRDLERIRSSVQYLFQDPYASLNPRRTVRQSLEEALATRDTSSVGQQHEILDLIERVGLRPRHLDQYPHAFSGGQRQRVGIARALASRPRVLICDEPVSALDVSIQAQILNLLKDLQVSMGLGYLLISHDLSVVRHLSDQVAVMYLGRIVETGTAESVYSRPQHPYTAALLSSSPVPDVGRRGEERIVLKGDLPSPADPPSGCRFRTRCPIGPLSHPDRTICVDQDPEPQKTTSGSTVACHFPGEAEAMGR